MRAPRRPERSASFGFSLLCEHARRRELATTGNAKSSYDWRRIRRNAVSATPRDSLRGSLAPTRCLLLRSSAYRPMPSAISHAAPALALYPLFRSRTPPRLWLLGVACAMAPDLDVLAFRFGIPY